MTADPSRAVLRTQAALHADEQRRRFVWVLLAIVALMPIAAVASYALLAAVMS